jgi:hypothetical protein
MLYVGATIWMLSGIGGDNLGSSICFLFLLRWWDGGGPWLGGFGGLSMVGVLSWWVSCPWWVSCLGPFTWRCFASEGPRLPSVRARFLFVLIHFDVGWFDLLSQN